jgi:DNA-binding MarR family transcriptional regulator
MRLTQLRQADLNLLVVFAVFAEERNVSRAAERLLLSQPAVSRALQRLRDMFHDDLFVRTAVGYELTPQGHVKASVLELETADSVHAAHSVVSRDGIRHKTHRGEPAYPDR